MERSSIHYFEAAGDEFTDHGSLHPSCRLVVHEALRADASQPESQALASAQGHSIWQKERRPRETSPLGGIKKLVRGTML